MISLLRFIVIFVLGAIVGGHFIYGPGKIEPKAKKIESKASPTIKTETKKIAQPKPQNKPVAEARAKVKQYQLYTVQIASFKDKTQAQRYVARLTNKDSIDAYIAPKDPKSGRYRIYVGEYTNKIDAQNKWKQLKGKFTDSFVKAF